MTQKIQKRTHADCIGSVKRKRRQLHIQNRPRAPNRITCPAHCKSGTLALQGEEGQLVGRTWRISPTMQQSPSYCVDCRGRLFGLQQGWHAVELGMDRMGGGEVRPSRVLVVGRDQRGELPWSTMQRWEATGHPWAVAGSDPSPAAWWVVAASDPSSWTTTARRGSLGERGSVISGGHGGGGRPPYGRLMAMQTGVRGRRPF